MNDIEYNVKNGNYSRIRRSHAEIGNLYVYP